MSSSHRATSWSPSANLRALLYRYFFFGWLFRNAGAVDRGSADAALRFNIRQRRYLAIYVRRWLFIFAVAMPAGIELQRANLNVAALVALLAGAFALWYLIIVAAVLLVLELASHDPSL